MRDAADHTQNNSAAVVLVLPLGPARLLLLDLLVDDRRELILTQILIHCIPHNTEKRRLHSQNVVVLIYCLVLLQVLLEVILGYFRGNSRRFLNLRSLSLPELPENIQESFFIISL